MKILISGGHLSPALSVIDEIKNKAEIVFVGRESEHKEILKRKITFYNLKAARFTRIFSTKTIVNFLIIPLGIYQSFKILYKERPNCILSFGGYISFPVCLVGLLLRIPIFIHEQTIKTGLANRITGLFARKIFISFQETEISFPKSKVILTGNPVRKTITQIIDKPFNLKKGRPVIYMTGGSLGSHSINLILESILPKLLEKFIVIHQTGDIKEYHDFARLSSLKKNLPREVQENYYLRKHFYEEELGFVYSNADIVVGRAGANTLFELIALEIPSILIPLPWSAGKEQLLHAELLRKSGVAEIFDQSGSPESLYLLIGKVVENKNDYKKSFNNLKSLYKKDAAKIIVQTIFSLHD